MARVDNAKLIVIKFTKKDKSIDVLISNKAVQEVFMQNDSKLTKYIEEIKSMIPERLTTKWVKIEVYLYTDKNNNPAVYTKINYSLALAKYLADECLVMVDVLNQYFTSVIKVAINSLDATKLDSVDTL